MTALAQTNTPPIGLLPAPYFFVRVFDVEAGASPEAVAEQIELAVEHWAPFPLGQIYFGYAWRQGSPRAVVYAAYRRRFTDDQQANWSGDAWVAPEFVPYLFVPAQAGQTLALTTETGVTAIHWSEPNHLPSRVVTRPFPPEADDAIRAAVSEETIRAVGGTVHLLEASGAPVLDGELGAGTWDFRIGDQTVTLSRAELDAMDVRDRESLVSIRKARRRDALLWRLWVVSLWVILGGLIAQLGFFAASRWEEGREQRLLRRQPEVDSINRSNELATRIEELATRRLLPFEMIDAVKEKKPANVVFRTVTVGAPGQIEISATTTNSADLPEYRAALAQNPKVQRAEFLDQNSRDRVTTFRLQVTFKPDAFDGGAK